MHKSLPKEYNTKKSLRTTALKLLADLTRNESYVFGHPLTSNKPFEIIQSFTATSALQAVSIRS